MMPMTFDASHNATLLFDIWRVHNVAGMLLSVLVVLLLTFFYELLKVWRVWLQSRYQPHQALDSVPLSCSNDSSSILSISRSESSRTAIETLPSPDLNNRNRLLLHVDQTGLHVLQVALGYMLMLLVMSYNVWIFLGVILGSALGYFISFPLLSKKQLR
ncbi:protein SLC31A2 [Cynoglossus semilaevis]|uniref:protein SLC31A2 n=1 Tax=Cynoglossus semilaevis TaxID=244447 RepID=UPI0007DCB1EC|nr:probable low affinity copper uptake protein 2 [Cynoglossus semilaevis]